MDSLPILVDASDVGVVGVDDGLCGSEREGSIMEYIARMKPEA